MPSRTQFARLLADRLDRLRSAFVALHRSVRDRVAEIVGTTVADVARQAVRVALDPPAPVAPAPRRVVRGDPDDRYDPWGGEEPDGWAGDRDAFEDGERDAWGHAPQMATTPPTAPAPAEPAVVPRLLTAAVVGLKAAAWWLATSRICRVWGCAAAGLVAGSAAYALGAPVCLAVAPAVAALTLAVRSVELVNTLPT